MSEPPPKPASRPHRRDTEIQAMLERPSMQSTPGRNGQPRTSPEHAVDHGSTEEPRRRGAGSPWWPEGREGTGCEVER